MGNEISFIELDWGCGLGVEGEGFGYFGWNVNVILRLVETVSTIFWGDGCWPPADPSQPARMDNPSIFYLYFGTFPYVNNCYNFGIHLSIFLTLYRTLAHFKKYVHGHWYEIHCFFAILFVLNQNFNNLSVQSQLS